MSGTAAPSPPPVFVDENGIVSGDLPCRGCSYNLRGLRVDSKCPECAAAIALSLQSNLLRYSDPAWLDRVGLGTVLILGGLLISVFLSLRVPLMFLMRPVQASMGLIASVLALTGTWLLTIPDPGAREGRGIALARMIARIGFAMAVARSILLFFVDSMHPLISALVGFGFLIAAMGRTGAEVARLLYVRQTALRIPDEKLASRAMSLSWAYGLCLGAYSILNAAISFTMLTLKERPDWLRSSIVPIRMISGLAGLGMTIFSIAYVFMLIRFGQAIQAQKMLARLMWGRPER